MDIGVFINNICCLELVKYGLLFFLLLLLFLFGGLVVNEGKLILFGIMFMNDSFWMVVIVFCN